MGTVEGPLSGGVGLNPVPVDPICHILVLVLKLRTRVTARRVTDRPAKRRLDVSDCPALSTRSAKRKLEVSDSPAHNTRSAKRLRASSSSTMGDGPPYVYREGEPPVLLGETGVPLWDGPRQWNAIKEAFKGDSHMRLILVPFGPRLGEVYTAYQRDPVPQTAVNPCAQPPLTEQQISHHGDLSYKPDTIPYTGDREE